MNFLVTGGNRGLGQKICERTGARSLSRANGFDITSPEGRTEIAKLSLEADVFVNNAFDGPPQLAHADFGQARLLKEVYRLWAEEKKIGYILNIGSAASLYPIKKYDSFATYRIAKMALDQASFACTRAYFSGDVPFRTSLLRMGRLDTPENRAKETWQGLGHDLDHLTESLISLARSPEGTCVYSLDMDTRLKL